MKQITTIIQMILIFTLVTGCGSSKWWSGEVDGYATISQKSSYGATSVVVPPRTVRISFPSHGTMRFGKDSLISDCTVLLSGGDVNSDEQMSGFDRAYKGEFNGGLPCEAYLSGSAATKIEIYEAMVKRSKETGEITVKLGFHTEKSNAVFYEFEFRGSKKGWF